MKNPYAKHDVVYIPEGLLTPQDDLVILGVADDVRQDVIYSFEGQALSISKLERSSIQRLKDLSIDVCGPADKERLRSIPIIPLKLVEFNVKGVNGALIVEDAPSALLDVEKVFAFTTNKSNVKALEKIVDYVNEKSEQLELQEDVALDVISKRLSSISVPDEPKPHSAPKLSF